MRKTKSKSATKRVIKRVTKTAMVRREPRVKRDVPRAIVEVEVTKVPIAVIGGAANQPGTSEHAWNAALETARRVGRELAKRKYYVICGGRTGVMEEVCRGCAEEGGTSIGVLPRTDPEEANKYCTIVIPTVLGNHKIHETRNRNSVIVAGALCAFAIAGGNGVRNELELARVNRKRVFGLHNPGNGWKPEIWNKENSGFTLHNVVDDALSECGKFIRKEHPKLVW